MPGISELYYRALRLLIKCGDLSRTTRGYKKQSKLIDMWKLKPASLKSTSEIIKPVEDYDNREPAGTKVVLTFNLQ
jgi:hypothetical protein